MKRQSKILICIIISVALFISPFSDFLSDVSAASTQRYKLSQLEPSQFTKNPTLLANLEKVFEEYPVAFTTTGNVCSRSHTGSNYCKTFTSHQKHKHSGTGTQCFGYANYVYETLFGTYWDFSEYIYSEGTLGSTTTAAGVKNEFMRIGACFGSIIRSNSPHSMIILSTDEDGIWILHANYGGSTYGGCNTAIHYYPWENFASAHGQLKYVIVPASICDKCIYTSESYPTCTECSHKFNGFSPIYATYEASSSTCSYSIPVEGNQSETTLSKGELITAVSICNLNGIDWIRCENGNFYKMTDFIFVSYKASLSASSLVYPEYIVNGKSFWLEGKVTSENIIKSLTVSILNTDGSTVDSNTIYPNKNNADVADADNLAFRKLSVGEYVYKLTATDDAETKVLYNGNFKVISSTTLAQAYPDAIFRKYIQNNILTGMSAEDTDYADKYDYIITSVKELNIANLGIRSLEGIERFKALENLDCSGNMITSINLSGLTHLCKANVSDQRFVTTAVYNSSEKTFTATVENVFFKTYSRPMNLPTTEYVSLKTGIDDLNMRLAIQVNADFCRFANVNPQEDSVVNSTDLSMLLSAYGSNSEEYQSYDINFDGIVNSADLSILLSEYGTTTE